MTAYRPGKATLVALGTGTAVASVCLLGVIMIRATVPGLWSLAAVAAAFAICRWLAGIFAHLVKTVPSGAGMFAFVSRAWGPQAGMVVIAPYVILMIFLGALEALIVGHLLAPWLAVPPLAIALVFLGVSGLICFAGVRMSFRIQAVTTWLLVAGVAAGAAWLLAGSFGSPGLAARLLAPPPSLAAFASGAGQAVFLFMGFELVCTQIESSDAGRIAAALKAIVWLLAALYGLALLAANAVAPLPAGGEGIDALIPFAVTSGEHGAFAALAAIALCLLASVTSLNGAFMGLSRLIAVMGSQRVLPAMLAKIHAPTLVARHAVASLLAASLAGALAIERFGAHRAVILAAAFSAATLYALALLVRERPAFRPVPRSLAGRAAHAFGVMLLAGLALGVFLDAGNQRGALLALLAVTYGAGALAALRLRLSRAAKPMAAMQGSKAT